MSKKKKEKYYEELKVKEESKKIENELNKLNENINILYDQKTTNELRWVEDLMK